MTNSIKHIMLTGLMLSTGSAHAWAGGYITRDGDTSPYTNTVVIVPSPFDIFRDIERFNRRILSESHSINSHQLRAPGLHVHDTIIEENGKKYLKLEVDGLASRDSELSPIKTETGLEINAKPGGKLSVSQEGMKLSITATASSSREERSDNGQSLSENQSTVTASKTVNGSVCFAQAEEPTLLTDQGRVVVKIPFNALASTTPEPAKAVEKIKTFAYNSATSTATQAK
jgi:hypothetical protein